MGTTPSGGKMTDLSSRISGAWKALTGKAQLPTEPTPQIGPDPIANQTPEGAPFGPLQPIPAFYQKTMAGRQYDYVTGYNLIYQPRANEPVTFDQLRALADNYDLVRLCIETRKDQLCKLKWTVRPVDKEADPDATCKQIEDFLRFPDGEHDWATWLRQLLEDLFVIDAPTVYPTVTKGGKLLSLDIMDGALIARRLDASGRTPRPPDVAYQQIIKGVPAVDYSRLDLSLAPKAKPGSELIYLPRNLRSWKAYGYSPVEQIIVTTNIGLRRQIYQLQYYTEGSMPDSVFQCPTDWTAEQIGQMQGLFDSLLSGNTAERRKARFVPGGPGAGIIDTKDKALKDEFDEWLARVVCFCFSLPPTAFIKSHNRATADNAKEQAQEEGTEALIVWLKGMMDMIIARFWDRKYEIIPSEETDIDPQVQAEIDKIYLQEYVISPDDVRQRLGLKGEAPVKPLPPAVGQPIPVGGDDGAIPGDGGTVDGGKTAGVGDGDSAAGADATKAQPGQKDTGKKSVEKAAAADLERVKKKTIKPIDRNRPEVAKARKDLTGTMSTFLADQSEDMAEQVYQAYLNYQDALDVDKVMASLDMTGWAALIDPSQKVLERVFADGSVAAFEQIDFGAEESMTNLMNQKALEYAEKRAADMVGMRNVGTKADPQWVENPDAKLAITQTTRERIKTQVSNAIENGSSPQQLRQSIIDNEAFGKSRADMISRTELAFADGKGNMAAYRASGVVMGKQWVLGSEHDDDDECNDNVAAGVIGLDDTFPSGDQEAPAHPNCVCDVVPVTMERE